ncbi:MinD/ParA family protein [Legionella septentrionalis]|uniref:MinD/ParA family protein n=1 Tax=Legionella septentrionalis TaxID=2498109 RepID=UPI000F8F7403|nr:MinD/ParA family protein [Legionella septentrionalis]RUR00609.1 MinD/ParA family protein [Legionella septentrionalis]
MTEKNTHGLSHALGLHKLMRTLPVKVIAVTSGKGGVGKSNISLNLAIALAQKNKKVLLLDADLGLPSLDVMLGLRSKHNLAHVIQGVCSLNDIILAGPANVFIIPGAADAEFMTNLTSAEHAGIINAFNHLAMEWNYMIIDTGAGISDAVLNFTRSAQEIITVVGDEPASLTSAYTLMKILNKRCKLHHFHILTNMMRSIEEGQRLFNKLYEMMDPWFDVHLDYLGAIPFDEHVYRAVKRQKPFITAFPTALATKAIIKLAETIEEWPVKLTVSGNTSFFFERLVG